MKWSRTPGRVSVSDARRASVRLDVSITANVLNARLSVGHGTSIGAAEIAGERAVDVADAESLAATIGSILNRATRWGDVDQGSRELLRQHGELLFDSVLPAAVKAGLRSLGGDDDEARRLTLVVDTALLALPWELMHTGRGFLGLDFAIGRIALGIAPELSLREGAASARRTLIVCDPRGDLIGSYYEGLTLREELAQRGAGFEVDLRSTQVSLGEVRRLLREYDVVHFAGHAEPVDGDRGWWLADGVLGPGAIRELAGGRRFPRLVFSNACRSVGEGADLAAAFIEAGVEHYVGTVHDVPDEPASLFALTFYETLAARPEAGIGEAVRAARVRLAERYGGDSVYWASWVLYGSPECESLATAATIVPIEAGAPYSEAAVATGIGARVRGAAVDSVVAAGPVAIDGSGWRVLARAATLAFSVFGLIAAVAVLATLVGRAPPLPWTEARAMPRIELPSRVVLEKAPHSVRFAVPEAGFVALWRVQGAGPIERVDAAHGPLRAVAAGELVEVPVSASGDEAGGGAERFYLAWRQVPPSDPRSFDDELVSQIRGMRAFASSTEARARFKEALDDRFDNVTELVVGP